MDILELLDREGLNIASDTKRVMAFAIDEVIISIIIFVGFYDNLISLNGDANKIADLLSSVLLYIFMLKVTYHTLFSAFYGASVGKIICKIKIVRLDTLDKPDFIYALSRSMIRMAAELLLYIPLIIAFADPFRRALHDLLVKTVVIDVSIPQDV